MERIVFHVDMDAFYASVEARDNPRLAHVPVVIGADPQGGRGRGVVSTANYAARVYGIHSAMPISRAYEACPQAVFLRPSFEKYKQASHEVMDVLRGYADVLEVVGMDEAYLDVTRRARNWRMARSLAHSLQAAVRRRTGLSCSVGISCTKSAAKIASDRRKPHGVTLIHPDELKDVLAPLPVKLVNGCGPKTAAALEEWDILTVGDLADADPVWLESRFGSHGRWLWRVANGDDPREVVDDHGPSKSRGNERTFLRDARHPAHVLTTAHRLLDGLLHDRHDGRPFQTLTVKLRTSDFVTRTRAITFPAPLDPKGKGTDERVQAACDAMLDELMDGRAVRLVGVRLSNFHESPGQQTLAGFGMQHVVAAA